MQVHQFQLRPLNDDIQINIVNCDLYEYIENIENTGDPLFQEDIQTKFERQFTSLELEIRKRDEIISQLQARIQELEQREMHNGDDSPGDSTEHDASFEEDLDDDREDHPFMRDGSVDTVLTTRPPYKRSSPSGSRNRRSWEEHSEEETLELQELPSSIVPHSLWKDEVAINLESNSDSSRSDDEFDERASCRTDSDNDEDEDEGGEVRRHGHNNWEVAMLAQELEARRRSSENANPGS